MGMTCSLDDCFRRLGRDRRAGAPKIVPGDIAVTRRANPDGILPTVINNKAEEMCSPPELQPNGRNGAPTDQPSGTPMLLNQHGAYKINAQSPRIAGALRLDRAVFAMTSVAAIEEARQSPETRTPLLAQRGSS
jgi:hypothetical protein